MVDCSDSLEEVGGDKDLQTATFVPADVVGITEEKEGEADSKNQDEAITTTPTSHVTGEISGSIHFCDPS